ncbi:MAG: 16S rRNA (uracil(1498)-N(3))-methyltransferase [Lachnospiraceae bacterium]
MHHFFVSQSQVGENEICILGADVNHIKNVLRMKLNETVLVSDEKGMEYTCQVEKMEADQVIVRIIDIQSMMHELPIEVTLYQGLPKADKLELIVQKSVELGASRIVPVAMARSIVKIEPKKEEAKRKRWNAISESAAKQSKRSKIPEVTGVMSYREALLDMKTLDRLIVPYELAEGMDGTRAVLSELKAGMKIGILIGPEGGFSPDEIEQVKQQGAQIISLGRRILRTETAGMAALAMLTYVLE